MAAQHDPHEGITTDGFIVTGADPRRVPAAFQQVLEAAIAAVRRSDPRISLYVYGSVATGTAEIPTSDVDLLTIGLPETSAREIADALSAEFADLCRSVSIGAGRPEDHQGDTWEAYGNRVFLRHYCVHLAGADHRSAMPPFRADAAAARGFNGGIARSLIRWRSELADAEDPIALARRIGRTSLYAVTGLVSVRTHTWTTDRVAAADVLAGMEPRLSAGLTTLVEWSVGAGTPDLSGIESALGGVVARIAELFEAEIGLWEA